MFLFLCLLGSYRILGWESLLTQKFEDICPLSLASYIGAENFSNFPFVFILNNVPLKKKKPHLLVLDSKTFDDLHDLVLSLFHYHIIFVLG
jgi:hypothetical protein